MRWVWFLGFAIGLAYLVTSIQEALGVLVHLKYPALTNVLHTEPPLAPHVPKSPHLLEDSEMGKMLACIDVSGVSSLCCVLISDLIPSTTGMNALIILGGKQRLQDAENLPRFFSRSTWDPETPALSPPLP